MKARGPADMAQNLATMKTQFQALGEKMDQMEQTRRRDVVRVVNRQQVNQMDNGMHELDEKPIPRDPNLSQRPREHFFEIGAKKTKIQDQECQVFVQSFDFSTVYFAPVSLPFGVWPPSDEMGIEYYLKYDKYNICGFAVKYT